MGKGEAFEEEAEAFESSLTQEEAELRKSVRSRSKALRLRVPEITQGGEIRDLPPDEKAEVDRIAALHLSVVGHMGDAEHELRQGKRFEDVRHFYVTADEELKANGY